MNNPIKSELMVDQQRQVLCQVNDLVAQSGVAVFCAGEQIALFYLPGGDPEIYAVSNYDPIGKANVLSRGIIGDIAGEPVVASPLYKQHFSLRTGVCIENPDVAIKVYTVVLEAGSIALELD
ncbi:MAG: nitrite reductase small subunit NirD [Pseudomonadota bacterium]